MHGSDNNIFHPVIVTSLQSIPLISQYRYNEEENVPKPAAQALEVKSEPAPETALKEEEAEQVAQNGEGDEHMYNGEQDDDDDIDFNLGGNGNSYDAPATHEQHGPGIKEDG